MTSIPKSAKQVFKGTVFDVYQWKQKLFNGKHKIFEVAVRQSTISVIATIKDKIVVLHMQQPRTPWYYTLPGGYIDVPGETPRQAALRELLEETGLKPKRFKLWRVYNEHSRMVSKHYFYIAQDCKKVSEIKPDGGEKIKVYLKSFDQFLQFSSVDSFHNHGLMIEMLRAKLDPKLKNKFKKLIFG